jgi:hypothetical protein
MMAPPAVDEAAVELVSASAANLSIPYGPYHAPPRAPPGYWRAATAQGQNASSSKTDSSTWEAALLFYPADEVPIYGDTQRSHADLHGGD